MLKKNNKVLFGIILMLLLFAFVIIGKKLTPRYDLNTPIKQYNIKNKEIRDHYIDYLKKHIKPQKLQKFANNKYISLSIYEENENGTIIIEQIKLNAIKRLFISLFDKSRTNFSDCPVSDNFKNKFNVNLIDYFNLYAADDYNVNCNLDMKNKNFTIEIYGIEGYSENLEPNYRNTYNFHYTLDDEDNVDNIELIEIEKQ